MSDPQLDVLSTAIQDLITLIITLRDKCPWDKAQTLNSLKNKIVEESYELVEAIEQDSTPLIQEEIGDVLFLALFFAQLFSDEKKVDIKNLVSVTIEKYKKKHPHVFKDKDLPDQEAVLRYWHESKEDMFSGISKMLPALLAAKTIQERVAKVGFDWENFMGPYEKVQEELMEIREHDDKESIAEEIGDLLFACVNLSRHLSIDPEDALRNANQKFVNRFRKVQEELKKQGKTIANATLKEMDAIWEKVKTGERS